MPTPASTSPRDDWNAIQDALMRVGAHLKHPTRLVVIGSSVGMWYGQPGRMTQDVDVWAPSSKVDLADIKQACEKAGIHFDPQEFDQPDAGLYLQMVKPGVVNVGRWKTEDSMFVSGNLEVVHPPAENIIASKLLRAEPADLEDIVFLMSRLAISKERVQAAVDTMPTRAREVASENMVYLELHSSVLADVNEVAARPTAAVKSTHRPPRP